jgi:hypothetical protein
MHLKGTKYLLPDWNDPSTTSSSLAFSLVFKQQLQHTVNVFPAISLLQPSCAVCLNSQYKLGHSALITRSRTVHAGLCVQLKVPHYPYIPPGVTSHLEKKLKQEEGELHAGRGGENFVKWSVSLSARCIVLAFSVINFSAVSRFLSPLTKLL